MTTRFRLFGGLALVGLVAIGGCSSTQPELPKPPRVDPVAAVFLPDPLAGYPLAVGDALVAAVRDLHRRLLLDGASPLLLADITTFIAREGTFAPAQLLLAEAYTLDRRDGEARALLGPWLAELPTWTAARIVDTKAAEAVGDIVAAWLGYRNLAASGGLAVAAERAGRLEERAIEVLSLRVRDGLSRGHLEVANEAAMILEQVVPSADVALEAVVAVAAALGQAEREESALVALVARRPTDRLLRERLAELTLARGDASAAIGILQDLLVEAPGDQVLLNRLAEAKFRFRLGVLPPGVRRLAESAVLQRAGFARLLYWLVPGVRVRPAPSAPIASDILDREDQHEIIRVLGWGFLDLDSGIREFEPGRSVRRREVLLATLRAQRFLGGATCSGVLEMARSPSNEVLCAVAAECGLLEDPAMCLPGAEISGAEAVAILGRGLEPRG